MNPYRALIANDGYAATFQSMGQYRTALLEAWPKFLDLENLADELLAPREIRRDENGHLQHPAMPSLCESVCIAEFLGAFGLECNAVAMEYDDRDAWDRYTEAENMDCSFWTPSTPAGEGWVLLEIFESEDGPSALYARRKPEAPRHSRRAHPSPFQAKVTRVKRRSGELVVQLEHQAPDRMYAGAQVTLHWRTEMPATKISGNGTGATLPAFDGTIERLATPASAAMGQVPEGWKLVPEEPTDNMTFVGQAARKSPANSITVVYQDMIAAAPQPPATGADDARDAARYRVARQHISVRQFCDSSGMPFPDLFGRNVADVIDELCDAALRASKEGA